MPDYLEQATNNRKAIAEIKRQLLSGEITREHAKQLAQPILDQVNTRSVKIAKKYGKKAYRISFSEAMRNNYQ